MDRKIIFVAQGSMYQLDWGSGAIRPYNAERMERDIELGYHLTVRPATSGELDYVERLNYHRRPVSVVEYDLELDGVL